MELPISLTALGVAYGVVVLGTLLQGSLGFGLGTLAVPVLLLVDPIFIPGPLLCLAFVLTMLLYRREKKAVLTHDIKWGVVGRVPGTLIGALLLVFVPQEYFTLLVGVLVLMALVLIYAGFRLPITTGNLIRVGALSGFMSTTASIGGPPMAMLYYEQAGPRLRGTLSGIFIFGTLLALLALAMIGRLGLGEMVVALSLLPALIIGFFLSRYSARVLDRGYIRPAILIVSGTAAVVVIVRHFL